MRHLRVFIYPSEPSGEYRVAASHASIPAEPASRVRLQNKPRRRSAHEVEVLVVRLRELGSTASPNPLSGFPLIWSNLPGSVAKSQLPPNVSRHVDLLAVFEPVIGESVEGTTDAPVILQIGRDAGPVREVRIVAALRRAVESLPGYFRPS